MRAAVELFQRLLLESDSLVLRSDCPVPFVTNYATALLLEGNVRGASVVLHELRREAHPAARRLRDAVASWRGRLSWWARLQYSLYGVVSVPITLDFPPGELCFPEPDVPRRAA